MTKIEGRVKRILSFIVSLVMAFSLINIPGPIVARAAAGDVPAHDKTLEVNGDGTYTIALNVTGDSEKQIQKVNVIVIVDRSGSMNSDAGTGEVTYTPTSANGTDLYGLIDGEYVPLTRRGRGTYSNPYTYWYDDTQYTGQRYSRQQANQSRLDATKEAVVNLSETLLGYNGKDGNPNDTVQMALVSFATSSQTNVSSTTSASTFTSAVNNLTVATGNAAGTNWESALKQANGINFGDSDPTYVIFFSDGAPTFYGTGPSGSGYEQEPNMSNSYNAAVDDAQTLANKVGTKNFYTIFAYGEDYGATYMTNLTSAAGAPAGNNYSASNTAELQEAFAQILEAIEMAGIGAVSMEDGTTSSVTTKTGEISHLLSVDEGSYKYYRAGGTDEEGNEKYDSTENEGLGEEWGDAPEASFEDGSVKWDLASEGVLENDVTYTVTFDCWPSQETLDIVADIKNDPSSYDNLDENIKKYIDRDGNLKTNTTASLSYTDTRTGERNSEDYVNPDPVATTAVKQLAIAKEWENNLDSESAEDLTLDVTRDGANKYQMTLNNDNGWTDNVYISVGILRTNGDEIEILEKGHDFTFKEPKDLSYHWELDVPTVRPMLIDGTVTILILKDAAHTNPDGADEYTIDGKTYYVGETEEAKLTATNYRRSSLQLTKTVEGVDIPEDATFPFTLNIVNALAPETEPTDDPYHDSDYWVWISVRDKDGNRINEGVTGATSNGSGWWYAPSGTDVTIPAKAGYSIRVNNLPTGSDYTITEGDLETGFIFDDAKIEITKGEGTAETFSVDKESRKATGKIESTNSIYQVTFNNKYELIDINVDKIWEDNSNQDGIRPDELTLTLNGLPEGTTVPTPEITKSEDKNTWTYVWKAVPRYDSEGKEIKYTVSEETVPEGYEVSGSPANDGGTITNTHEPEKTEVSITKEWDDDNDIGGIRPESIQVQLKADGTAVGDAVTLNVDNDWTYTWEGLDKFKDGKEIKYFADEIAAPNGYTKQGPEGEDGEFTVTNKYTPKSTTVSFPVKKNMVIPEGLTGPEEWGYNIEVNPVGDAPKAEIMNGHVSGPTSSTETDTFTFGPFTYEKPGTYKYTVTEQGIIAGVTNDTEAEKTVTVTVTDDGEGELVAVADSTEEEPLTFTNTYGIEEPVKVSFPVKKALEVPEGLTGPSEWSYDVTVTAKDDAPEAESMEGTVSNENDTVSFGDFEFSAPGEYTYEVTEEGEIDGVTNDQQTTKTVTVTVTDKGDGTLEAEVSSTEEEPLTFTNTYGIEEPVKASFPVKKVLEVPEGLTGPSEWSYDVTVTAKDGAPAAESMTGTVSNENDTVSFGDFEFSMPGEYTYEVTEAGEIDGVTNDKETKKTVTVTVTDKGDGTLEAEVSSTEEEPLTFTNTYGIKEPVTASFPVEKVMTVPAGMEGPESWSYTIKVEAEDEAPEADAMEGTVSNENKTVTFGDFTFDMPGEYTYTVTEEGEISGVTNDEKAESGKTVTITVTDKGDGTLEAKADFDEENPLKFTNTYGVSPATISFPVKKVLEVPEGLTGPEEWSYEIAAEPVDGAPEGESMTGEVTNEKDTVTIGAFTFTAPGTYTYKVTESGEVDGVKNDEQAESGKTVTITVTDKGDGTLEAKADFDEENPLTFTNTYGIEEPAKASFPVKKTMVVPDGMKGPETWSYTIDVKAQEGAPEAAAMTGTVSNDKDTVTFGEFAYDMPGVYKYTVTEKGTVEGVDNDEEAASGKIVTVTVTDNGDGTLTAKADFTADSPLTFTNTYKVEPTTVNFPVKKVLSVPEGMDGPAEWSYKIDVEAEDDAPEAETMTGTVDQDNVTAVFGPFSYTEPGTYEYTVSETGTVSGVANDAQAAGKTVTVTVVDNGDGTLTAAATSTDASPLSFTNTYSAEPAKAEFPVKKILSVPEGMDGPASWSYDVKVEAQGDAPEAETMTGKVTNTADTVKFEGFVFEEPGTYTYKVTESGEIAGVENDKDASAGKIVTVTVTDKGDGTLEATADSTDNKPLTFTNTYAAKPGEITFPVKKVISLPEGMTGPAEWSYDIKVEAGEGSPEVETMTGTVSNETDTVSFGPFKFEKPGTYTYSVTESGEVEGVTNDEQTTKTVTITVEDDGQGGLKISSSSTADSPLTFTNVYDASGSVELKASKILQNREWNEGESYTFELADDAGTIDTQTVDANEEVTFKAIDYTAEDVGKTFKYTITETGDMESAGLKPSDPIEVTVTVKDGGDGTLVASPVYTNNGTITNTYDAKGSIELTAQKKLEGREWQSGEEYTFTLVDEKGAVVDKQTVSQDGTVTFKAIEYGLADRDKTYKYTIHESVETEKKYPNVTSSGDIEVKVTVTDNKDGTLKATPEYSDGETIINTYVPEPVNAAIEVSKTITGYVNTEYGNADNVFKFTLTGPNVEGQLETSITTENGTGKSVFDSIKFTEPGEYVYEITETKESLAGFKYDEKTYNATITVKDNPETGKLEATVNYGDDKTDVGFTNEFEEEEIEVTLHLKKIIEDLSDSAKDATFTFELKDADGNVLQTKEVTTEDLEGTVDFDKITYKQSGVYTYTLTEVVPVPASSAEEAAPEENAEASEENAEEAAAEEEGAEGTEEGAQEVTEEQTSEEESAEEEDYNPWTYDTKEHQVEITVKDNISDEEAKLTADVKIDGEDSSDLLLTVTNVYKAKKTNVTLYVKKVVEDTSGSAYDATFTFDLIEGEETIDTAEITIGGDKKEGTAYFAPIEYEKAGEYEYVITEEAGSAAGYIYDGEAYPVKVTIEDVDGELQPTVDYGSGSTELTITNTYDPKDAAATIEARKVVDDQSLSAPDETFTFVLEGEGITDSKTHENGGYVYFDELTYSKVGTYKYTITEESGATAGYTYDTEGREVEVTVTDDGTGQLVADVKYLTDEGEAVITNPYKAEPTSLVFEVNKKIESELSEIIDKEFEFTLTDGEGQDIDSVTVKGAGSASFGEIVYEQCGTYNYIISEVNGEIGGYTYDTSKYAVEVNVTDEAGKLVADAKITKNGEETDEITFTNKYQVSPVVVQLEATKELTGRELAAGEFKFEAYQGNTKLADAVNNADGSVIFSPIKFTKVGTYNITVKEVEGSLDRVTYDTTEYAVKIEISDNGEGKLVAEVTGADNMVFKNIYDPGVPDDEEEHKRNVPTGDDSNMAGWLAAMVGAGAVGGGLLVYRKKKKDEEAEA